MKSPLPESLLIDGETAFWNGLTVHDTAAIDRLTACPYSSGDHVHPIEPWSDTSFHDEPVVWQNHARTEAFVNERCFGDLEVVDATSLKSPRTIGEVRSKFSASWPPDRIIRFLLLAGIVRTFIHVEAKLQRSERTVSGQGYAETYNGEHVYFTNREVRSRLGFTLIVSTKGMVNIQPKQSSTKAAATSR